MSIKKFRRLKILLAATTICIIINIYAELSYRSYIPLEIDDSLNDHGKWRKLSQDQIHNLSNLGRILFLDETPQVAVPQTTVYKILVWKFGEFLTTRHIRNPSNPLQDCSVQNCVLTYEDADIKTADLVVFLLHRIQNVKEIPARTAGSSQIWTFLTDESPYNTFLYRVNNTVDFYNGIFNWSMSYRLVSDIPVPYGRTVPLKNKMDKFNVADWNKSKKQDVLVAIVISNCSEKRLMYIKELSKYVRVDAYGGCGTLQCPGHFHTDCKIISDYKFYLSFENTECDEYITEKVWWSGYHKKAIPVIMGGSKLSLQQSLPPNSYIDVNDFASPKDLASYLLYLNSSLNEMESFFKWKRDFQVLNEHGYFHSLSVHYCRICEALNYNSKKTKIYNNLNDFISLNVCR